METELSQQARRTLRKTAGWIRFYAVIQFILSAAFIFFSYYSYSSIYGFYNSALFSVVILLVGVVIGFLGVMLWKYAQKQLDFANTGELSHYENGLGSYKIFFLTWGILTILTTIWMLYSFTL